MNELEEKKKCMIKSCLFCIVKPIRKIDSWIRKYRCPVELMAIILALINYCMIEIEFDSSPIKYRPLFTLLNIFIIFCIFMLFAVLSKHTKVGFVIGNILMYVYMVSQFYLIYFRGAPWQFSDLNFATMEGGAEVAGGYSFVLEIGLVVEFFITLLLCIIVVRVRYRNFHIIKRLIEAIVLLAICCISFSQFESMLNTAITDKKVDFYNRSQPYRKIGQVLMFCMDAMSGGIKKPSQYSTENAQKIANDYEQAESSNSIRKENETLKQCSKQDTEDMPNIIGIMNESFSDLSHLNDKFESNEDYMPFIHSLNENVIKGYVTVSAYGGYSCNSEYEFLTGNTLGFLPVGSTTFTQFLQNTQPSLVSQLKSYGYKTIGFSGCRSNIWGLKNAYSQLQFDKTIFYEDLQEITSIQKYRDYVTDECLFKQVEKMFDEKEDGEKYFVWNTTMQNHGGYSGEDKGEVKIDADELSNSTQNEVSEYLSSIKKSDEAFEQLVEYFKDYKEKVVIVMYGDHYPHLPDVYKYLFGKDLSSLSVKNNELLHQTPFIIWANYDIGQEEINNISLNYLSTVLMEVAGLKKSGYQNFLTDLYQTLPIISEFGYEDKDGNVYAYKTDKKYDKILNNYNILQYNNMFGKRIENFFD